MTILDISYEYSPCNIYIMEFINDKIYQILAQYTQVYYQYLWKVDPPKKPAIICVYIWYKGKQGNAAVQILNVSKRPTTQFCMIEGPGTVDILHEIFLAVMHKLFPYHPLVLTMEAREYISSNCGSGDDVHVSDTTRNWWLLSWWRHHMETFSALLTRCAEFTGDRWIPLTDASDEELWRFLWSAPEQTVETLVIWDAIVVIMTSL